MAQVRHGEVDTSTWSAERIRQTNLFHLAIYQQMLVNDTAVMSFYDLLEELGRHPDIYKGGTKFRAGILRRQLRKYNARIDKRLGHGDTFLTQLFEIFEEKTAPLKQKMEQSLINLWNSQKESEPVLLMRITMADVWAGGMLDNSRKVREQMNGKLDTRLLPLVMAEEQKDVSMAAQQLTASIRGIGELQRMGEKEIPEFWVAPARHGVKGIMNILSSPENIIEAVDRIS